MKYFIIIDVQNDFCTGALANPAAAKIIPGIVVKAKELKEKGYKIIATRDTHSDDYLETQEGKKLPVTHCINKTEGWEVVDEIKPLVDMYIDKPTFGFNGWEAAIGSFNRLWSEFPNGNFYQPEEIEMCGTVTEICVVNNALILKASYPEIPITVHKDLCAGLSDEAHAAAITVMKSSQIDVV